MSSTNFELCNDISCNNYDATAVFYVSLALFRNIFKFETTEITNNQLSSTALTSSQNITYYIDTSNYPIINPAHAMMDASGSEGITFTSTARTSNLLKHDFLYYIAKELLGSATSVGLYNNITEMKTSLEELGWSNKTIVESTLSTSSNNNNGKKNIVYSSNNQYNTPSSNTILLSSTYEFTDPTYLDPLLITGVNGEYLFTDSGGTSNDYTSGETRAITFDAGEGNTFQIKIVNLEFEIGSYYYYDRLGLTASNNLSDLNTSGAQLSLTTAPLLSDFMYETDSTNPTIVWGRSFDATHDGNGGWIFPPTHNSSSVTTDTWLDINTRFIRFYFTSDSSVTRFGWQIKIRNKNQTSTTPTIEKTNIYFKQNSDASVSPFFLFYSDNQCTQKIKKLEKNKPYRFYYNNPQNIVDSGHPFWFGSTNSHQSSLDSLITLRPSNSSRNNTSGIQAGEYLDIEIDINYTGSLYYYCTTHSSMIKQMDITYPVDSTNLTKRILEQINEADSDRLTVYSQNSSSGNYDIQDSTAQGSVVINSSIHRYDYYGYTSPIRITGEYTFYDSGGSTSDYSSAEKNAITFDAGANNVVFLKIIKLSFEASSSYPYHWDRLGITAANNITDLETDNLNTTVAPELSAFLYQSQNNDPTAGYNNRYVVDSYDDPITGGYIFPSSHTTDSVGNSNVVINTWFKINTRYVRFYFYSDSSLTEPGWDIRLAPGTPATSNNSSFDTNSRIQNVTTQQSVPLIEGDSINYYWTLNHSSVTKRKYRIKLHLTDNTNNTNTQPTDSIANTTGYTNITSNGVPSF